MLRKEGIELKSITQTIAKLIIFLTIPIFALGIIYGDNSLACWTVIALWLAIFIIKFSRKNVMILAFLITFFMFLLGELLINQFEETAFHAESLASEMHAYTCIYISLLFFYFGTKMENIKFSIGNSKRYYQNTNVKNRNIYYIQKACKCLYLLFAMCSLAEALEKLMLSLAMGSYTATFINYKSMLPGVVSKLADMADMVFFIFLATLPDPRKAKSVFGLKVLISLIMLAFGTRNPIVLTFLIISIYCVFYENIYSGAYTIIPKWVYCVCVGLIPFVLMFFDFIMAYRDGRIYDSNGIIDSVKHIVASLGGSVNVITYGFENATNLPDKIYSLGGITDFFTQNVIARTIFDIQQYSGNTVGMALYGNRFSYALTYLVKPSSYLAGYGMGSSYIAEVFHDFGYVGVAIINVLYGKICTTTSSLKKDSIIRNTIVLMSSYAILTAPRSYADGFISCFFNFSFILTVFLVFVVAKIIKSRKKI